MEDNPRDLEPAFENIDDLFLQPADDFPDMIIVDEPELGLHPEAETLLAGLIRSVSSRCQVLLATQSASFVDHFEPENVIVCEMESGASAFYRPTQPPFPPFSTSKPHFLDASLLFSPENSNCSSTIISKNGCGVPRATRVLMKFRIQPVPADFCL